MLVLAAFVAGQASSCRKEAGTDSPSKGETYTFTCTIADDPDSKVAISESGKVTWEPGDCILVHGEGSSNRTTVTLAAGDISSDGKTATISFSGITPYNRSSDGVTSTFYAAYPADAVNGGNLYWYTTFAETNRPLMAAFNQGSTFRFYNCTAVIAFKVSGDFDSYSFEGEDGETVAYDKYEVKLVYKSGPSLDFNHWTDGPMSVVEGSVVADGSTVNRLFIPQGANFQHGFTFKFKKDGKLVKVAHSDSAVNLARNKMLNLGDITARLTDPSSSDTHTSSIPTADAVDLGANGTANCYIVEDPGVYKFKAVKGNSTQSVGTVAGVEVLWETVCTATAPAKCSVVEKVDFEDKYIYLQMPSSHTAGNAVVAARNAAGDIIWSWHIWAPANTIETDTYKLASSLMMDRNLGALTTAPSSGDGRCFGLLYQWGRKDPFPGMQSISSSKASAITGTEITFESGAVALDKTIANPTVFYTVNNASWITPDSDDLWGGASGSKSIYDPCPPGYKVPGSSEAGALFSDFTALGGWSSDIPAGYFKVGDPQASFPYAGYIDDYITSLYCHSGDRAFIWSSEGTSGVKAYGQDLRYDKDNVAYTSKRKENPKARGGSVRCISEETVPFVNEPGMPVMGSYTKTDFTAAQMAELSGLCFSKDKDFMWGVGDGGTLYKIGFDMSVSVQMDPTATSEADLEGVTMDPVTKDLYYCCEPNRVRKTTAPGYNNITKIFEVADAADFGNSGLEGITYYKDNVLYVGSQSGAWLWAYNVNGTLIWKKQLGPIAPGIQEVGDLYYDPETDLLWVSDSEAFKLFVFDGAVTTLKAIYDISFVGNPESVLVDHDRGCVWIGDDRGSSSRIYKVMFSNLGGGGSGGTASTLCKPECLGQKPMLVAYLTEDTSASSLDADCVTHINYAHGRFKNPSTGDGGIVISGTSLLKKVLALKNSKPSLKVLLMIGGWGAKANGFSQMACDAAKRTAFCQSCKEHILNYGLDGIDIDWEYPTYSAEGNAARSDDKENFNLVLKELRETIGDTKIISFASSSDADYVDWPTAIKYIDYVNVMTYDMGSAPERHNSPLYRSSQFKQTSCSESVDLHVNAGVPMNRQNLGVPFYGKAYKGGNSKYPDSIYKIYPYEVNYNQMADIFDKGTVTGRMYNEDDKVTVDVNGKNIRHWDSTAKVPYLTDTEGHVLLCYDDAESVACKGEFVLSKGLCGAMFWEYRHDDSAGTLRRALCKAVYGKESTQ